MDRPSCGACKYFKDVGYRDWGECTAQVPCWAWSEYIETTRQVFRDGSTTDFAPECEAYTPNAMLDQSDIETLVLRLLLEDENTFAPETKEVMDRWKGQVMEKFRIKKM